jgi:hypothetical protein
MQTSPETHNIFVEGTRNDADERSLRMANRVYQGLTVAAMLGLLVSLWVF